MTSLFLGMDVGGTHTRAVLVDSRGRVAGVGRAASANPHNVGMGAARKRIRQAASSAWAAAGMSFRSARHAFLGCAGVKSGVDIAEMRALAESDGLAPPGEVAVKNDLYNALAGGLGGRPGIALIAGTGSNCLGRDSRGRTFMCGGWGWLLDDRGGAFDISAEAVRSVARAADGRGKATSLSEAALAFFGISDPDDLISAFYGRGLKPGQIAEFAPVVVRCAADGDTVAKRILLRGARALSELVGGVSRALKFPRGPEIVLLGGCGRGGGIYQSLVEREIRSACPAGRLVEPEGTPLEGAATNALREAGVRPIPAIRREGFDL